MASATEPHGPASPAQPPGGSGTIDVKPSDLWSVSGRVAAQQDFLVRGAKTLLEELGEYPDAGGAGTEAEKFARAYTKIGNRWLEVWGRSVLSVGGVAVGFTETANAYTRADAAAHPKPGKTAEQRPRPAVIDKDPNLGSIPDIKWGDDDGGDDILREYAEAAVDLNRDVKDELDRAMWKAAKDIIEDLAKPKDLKSALGAATSLLGSGAGLLLSFDVKTVLNLDTAKLNGIVAKYAGILEGLTTRMKALEGPLDEAYRSAPKFEAGVARAHGFGTRALEEFKDSKVWLKVDSNGNYDLNLAANEYMANGHTLDKHVGKTDEQLAQRLRDQQSGGSTTAWPHGKPMPSGSSAFPNYQRAEELTERNLNKNKAAIEAWIKEPPPVSDGDVKSFYDKVPSGETSGRSVSKQPVDPNDPLSGYKQGGLNAKAYDVSGVDTRIRYDSNRNPPFTVMTSMPSKI